MSLAAACMFLLLTPPSPGPTPTAAPLPNGWALRPSPHTDADTYQARLDTTTQRQGRPTLHVRSENPSARGMGVLLKDEPAELFRSKKVRFSALLKREDVKYAASLWMKVAGGARTIVSTRMRDRAIGTADWERREVVLPVPGDAQQITYGLLLWGPGRAWLDEAKLEVAPDDTPTAEPQPPANLAFESPEVGGLPPSWHKAGNRPADYDMGVDSTILHGGKGSAFVRSNADVEGGFGTLMQVADADAYRGRRVRLSAFVRAEKLAAWAGVWLRVDDGPFDPTVDTKTLAFDNMSRRRIEGTRDWARHEIVLDVPEAADTLNFGVLLEGNGAVWMDDLVIETVGTDIPVTSTSH